MTPLLWAALSGHDAIVRLPLEEGATLGAKDGFRGMTSLFWASWNGHQAVVRLLLDHMVEDTNMSGLLLCAAENGHEAVVKLLLEKGADIEAKDTKGKTALSRAAWQGHQ